MSYEPSSGLDFFFIHFFLPQWSEVCISIYILLQLNIFLALWAWYVPKFPEQWSHIHGTIFRKKNISQEFNIVESSWYYRLSYRSPNKFLCWGIQTYLFIVPFPQEKKISRIEHSWIIIMTEVNLMVKPS